MLLSAKERGFEPECVCFDSWYASLKNLKTVRDYGWTWLTRLAFNRLVNKDYQGNQPVSTVEIAPTGTVVHLKGYGLIKVFRIDTTDKAFIIRNDKKPLVTRNTGQPMTLR